jgi:hypothetical protein
MATNDYDDEQLNHHIDEILSSDDALESALQGDNPLLHLVARLTNQADLVPSEAMKARMWERVQAAQISSPNFSSWQIALGAVSVIVIVIAASWASSNISSENIPDSNIEQTQNSEQLTQELFSEEILTEESSSETLSAETEQVIITTENIEPEPSPTSTVEANPQLAISSDLLFVNPGGAVNLRSGPGTSFEIVAIVTPNTQLNKIGMNATGDWLEVVLHDGTQGWIASLLVSERQGSDGQPVSPGSGGRDTDDECDKSGNACNAPGQNQENRGNSNNRDNNKND